MRIIQINCDTCGRDLTLTGNSIDYRIVIHSERIPAAEGPVTDMMIHPAVPQPLHFCHIPCLKKWIAAQ